MCQAEMKTEMPWVAHIQEEINNLVDLDPKDRARCSMFRVPPSVRRVKPHLYSPQIIPFGLYSIERIRNEKISPMDRLKLEVATVILKIIKAPYTECYQHYDAALDCLNLPKISPNQLHPIFSDLVSSLSRLPYASQDSEGKLEIMRGRIAGLKAMAHAPGYHLRERETRLLSADLNACFEVFVGFLDMSSSDNNPKDWKWLCNKVVGDLSVMDFYDDVRDMYEGAARSLLTLDAVFLVGFMLSLHAGSGPDSKIQIEELGWFNPVLDVFRKDEVRCNIQVIAFDMWLMENQIPLTMIRSALECMWEVSNQSRRSPDAGKALTILVRHAVKRVLHLVPGDCSKHSTSIEAVPISECKNLLECLYRVICPSVKTRSSGCQHKSSRPRSRVMETSNVSAADFVACFEGDVKRKKKGASRSRSSPSLDVSARYPDPPGVVASLSSPDSSRTQEHPIRASAPLFLHGNSLYLYSNSSSFPAFSSSPPSSPGKRESSSSPAPHPPTRKQFDRYSSPLKPQQQSALPISSVGGDYHLFTSTATEEGLVNGEHREVDRYGRMNGHHEPVTTTFSEWNTHDSLLCSVNYTDAELETPFRSAPRSPPLPVSDTMDMDDDGLNHHVEFTLSDSQSRNNSYSTLTIDLPQIHVAKLRPGAQSNLPITDGSPPFLHKLRTASMKTVGSVQSAGHWVGSPWRLFRKIFARRGVLAYEKKLSYVGMYDSRGAATFSRDRATKPASVVSACPMSGMRILPVPSATQLRKTGIRCRSGSQVGCKPLLGEGEGFGVFWPTLFLPKLLVDENTERILQNLVAFEFVSASDHELMSFLRFMSDLVKTEEDVQMLKQGEKAVLWLTSPISDFEVITMFSNLLQNCHFTETIRSRDLRKELTHCYSRPWRRMSHTVISTICSRSGILILLVAATFMLVALQAVYMLLDYYRSIV